MNKAKLSRLRQSLVQLNKEAVVLAEALLSNSALMAGSVYRMKRKCGNKNCVCFLKGKLHESTVLSLKENGETKIRMLKAEEVERVSALTEEGKRARKIRTRLVAVQKKILTVSDQIYHLRAEKFV